MCASVPSMTGDPRLEGLQSISANLSGSLEPNRAETSFCFSCNTLTQKCPLASMACHDLDTLVGQNNTNGGCSDSAANDWHAKPTGAPSCMVVITVIPVQNCPSTLRNVRGSSGCLVIIRCSSRKRSSLRLEADAEVVPPQADGRALARDPVVIVDRQSLAAEFDVETAWRLHVERQHLVVDMPAQRRRHRHLAPQRAVQAQPNVVGVLHLDHQMHDAAWSFAGHERQAVVTRVDSEESKPSRWAIGRPTDKLRRQSHRITQVEAQYVTVEVQRLGVVTGGEHNVSEALFFGDELVSVRADDATVLKSRAVEHLQGVARRILEPDQLVDATVRQFGLGCLLVRGALEVEPVADFLQRRGIGGFPAGLQQPVVVSRHNHQSGRELVHPQVQRPLSLALALDHAEDLQTVFTPRRDVGCLDAQITQRPDAHDPPPRKSTVSLLNSSNFSNCAQCPHCPKTCNCTLGICLSATSAPSSGLTRSSRPQMRSTRWRSLYTSRHIMPSSKSGPANDFPIARVAASDSGVLAIAKRSSTSSG